MADFSPNDKVKVTLSRPFPGPGFALPDGERIMVGDSVTVSGARAEDIKEHVEAKTHAPMDSFTFEVVEEGGDEVLEDYIQDWRAENLREEGFTLDKAKGMSDEELKAVDGIGQATADKIPNEE